MVALDMHGLSTFLILELILWYSMEEKIKYDKKYLTSSIFIQPRFSLALLWARLVSFRTKCRSLIWYQSGSEYLKTWFSGLCQIVGNKVFIWPTFVVRYDL